MKAVNFGLLLIIVAFVLTIAACGLPDTAAQPSATAENQTEFAQTNVTDDDKKANKRTPVIVELFTSEGCSSCPPADRTLELLVREQPFAGAEIIPLSQHVDYWNRLGWADPFSSSQFSERQSEYAAFFKRSGVYTPQMVVDGTREFVGSNMLEAQRTILEAAKAEKAVVNLMAKIEKDAVALDVKVENLPDNFDSANILLAVTEDNLTSSVSHGENAGQKLSHVAVVRSLTNIGLLKAGQKSVVAPIFQLQKDWKRENLSAVVFVQDVKTRQILGAGKVSLKNFVSIGK